MSTCTKWIDHIEITLTNWIYHATENCIKTLQQDGCAESADEGHWGDDCLDWIAIKGDCADLEECHWYTPWDCIAGFFCNAWNWIAHGICKVFNWIANWVCKIYNWIVKWVCKIFFWFVKLVSTIIFWFAKLICVAWDTIRCAFVNLFNGIASLLGGRKKSKAKIEHIFVLMLENRSFDHMLGFSGISGTEASKDKNKTGNPTSIDGLNSAIHKNINPVDGSEVAVNSPADFLLKNIDKDPEHEFSNVLIQLCGEGATYNPTIGGYPSINNSGFIQNYKFQKDEKGQDNSSSTPERIMKCFSPEQLPVLNQLAKEFCVCDHWFSSLPGPTWPNRFFMLAATSGGLDDSPSPADIIEATSLEGYRFENGNIFDLLDDYCLDWKIFEGDEFPVSFALNGMNLNALQGRFKDFGDFESELNKVDFNEKFVFIEPKYGEDEFDITGPGDYVCGNSMHPLNDVTRGEKLIKKVYETIRNSPHWEKSLLVITFDEHGGFYDHVPPSKAVPPGDIANPSNVINNFKFDQLGVRVPSIIISPFIKKNVIDHTEYDHTSCLATMERLYGMSHLTERDKAANDFLHLFTLDTPRTDTPAILVNAANSGFKCEDDKTAEDLIATRSELLVARKQGSKNYKQLKDTNITPMQIGFAHVALLKVLQVSEYPEREKWKEEFKNLDNRFDVALFMTEAKLKIKHCIDFKKILRDAENSMSIKDYKSRCEKSTK